MRVEECIQRFVKCLEITYMSNFGVLESCANILLEELNYCLVRTSLKSEINVMTASCTDHHIVSMRQPQPSETYMLASESSEAAHGSAIEPQNTMKIAKKNTFVEL